MFLKAIVHLSSSPAKTVESSSQRTKTRMLPESSVMVKLLQDEGVRVEESLIIAVDVEGVGGCFAVTLRRFVAPWTRVSEGRGTNDATSRSPSTECSVLLLLRLCSAESRRRTWRVWLQQRYIVLGNSLPVNRDPTTRTRPAHAPSKLSTMVDTCITADCHQVPPSVCLVLSQCWPLSSVCNPGRLPADTLRHV